MKKIISIALVVLMLGASLASFASCGAKTASVGNAEELHKATDGGSVEVTNGAVSKYKGVNKNIEITSDFTVETDDKFFTEVVGTYDLKDYAPGRIMEGSVINGNGYTITVKGDSNGTLGRYSAGLFGRLINCEVKNLNVVYDTDVNLSSSKSMGGICGVAENCTFTDCTVTYKRNVNFSGYRAGGIAGLFTGTMENCIVTGDLKASLEHFGGIAGGLNDGSTAKNCSFNGSFEASNLHNAEVGGLFGWIGGEASVSGSKVTLSKLSVWGQTDKWTTYNAYCGGIVGKLYGELYDCILELPEGAKVSATENSSGAFRTNMHTGLVAGWATDKSKIGGIFIDALGDGAANLSFPEKTQKIALGVYKNESKSVERIFYADDEFALQHTERVKNCVETKVPNSYDILYSFTMLDMPCTARVCRDEKGEKVNYLLLTVDGAEYSIDFESSFSNKMGFAEEIDGFLYKVTVDEANNTVEFSKTAPKFIEHCGKLVTDYSEIYFGSQGAWTTDADGKPILNY